MRISKIVVVVLLFAVAVFAVPIRAQSNFKIFASGGLGKSGTAFGPILRMGIEKTFWKDFSIQPYFSLSYSWYSTPTNGGKVWVHDETRSFGFNLVGPKVIYGIRPMFWFENGWRRSDVDFSDPSGNAFRNRNTGYHATPGIGVERNLKRGFTFSVQVGKEISPDPTTRALWDIRAFGTIKYEFGLGGLKRFKP
jgi:hypothetical protein